MEVRFEARVRADLNSCRALARVTRKKGVAAVALAFLAGAIALAIGALSRRSFELGVLAAVCLVGAVYYAFFLEKRLAATLLRDFTRPGGAETTLRFDDEGVDAERAAQTFRVRYASFVRVALCRNYCLLFLRANSAYVIPRAAFTLGDAAAFPAFIAEKTGLAVEKIR